MRLARVFVLFLTFAILGIVVVLAKQSAVGHRSVTIENRSSLPIVSVYASNINKSNWGPDLLGSNESIQPKYQREFALDDGTDQCYFDLQVVFSDTHTRSLKNGDVCRPDQVWTVDDAKGVLKLKVTDKASVAVRYLYAVNMKDAAKGWGDDLLGPGNVIWSGTSQTFNVYQGTPGCHYDLRAVYFNGEEVQETDFDFCKYDTWVVGASAPSN